MSRSAPRCRIHHTLLVAGPEIAAPGGLRRVFFSCPIATCTTFEAVTQAEMRTGPDDQPALARCADAMTELGRC